MKHHNTSITKKKKMKKIRKRLPKTTQNRVFNIKSTNKVAFKMIKSKCNKWVEKIVLRAVKIKKKNVNIYTETV